MRRLFWFLLLVAFGACTFSIGTSNDSAEDGGLPLIDSPADLSDFYTGAYTLELIDKMVEVRTKTTESGYPDADAEDSARELAATIATDTVLAIAVDPDSINEDYFDPYNDNNMIFIGLFGKDTEDTSDSDRFEFTESAIEYRHLKVSYIEDAIGTLAGESCNYHIVNGIEVVSDEDGPAEVKWQMSYHISGDGDSCLRVSEIIYSASWRVRQLSDDPFDVLPDVVADGTGDAREGAERVRDYIDEQIEKPYSPYYEYLPADNGLGIPI